MLPLSTADVPRLPAVTREVPLALTELAYVIGEAVLLERNRPLLLPLPQPPLDVIALMTCADSLSLGALLTS